MDSFKEPESGIVEATGAVHWLGNEGALCKGAGRVKCWVPIAQGHAGSGLVNN